MNNYRLKTFYNTIYVLYNQQTIQAFRTQYKQPQPKYQQNQILSCWGIGYPKIFVNNFICI